MDLLPTRSTNGPAVRPVDKSSRVSGTPFRSRQRTSHLQAHGPVDVAGECDRATLCDRFSSEVLGAAQFQFGIQVTTHCISLWLRAHATNPPPSGARSPKPREFPQAVHQEFRAGWRFSGPLRENLRPFEPTRGQRRGHRRLISAWQTGTWSWRRRPDLNRGWRFCRRYRIVLRRARLRLLVPDAAWFSVVFGR